MAARAVSHSSADSHQVLAIPSAVHGLMICPVSGLSVHPWSPSELVKYPRLCLHMPLMPGHATPSLGVVEECDSARLG